MAVIFTDNSKSSQVYTTLLKKYVFPYATVVHLTKEAEDFYEHVVAGTEPKNEKLRNQNHVIILAEDFKDPKVADAVLLLSKENFRSQITWYRKYIDVVDETPTTYKEIGKLVVSTHGRMRTVSKLIPVLGKRMIEDFLEVYYGGRNATMVSVEMNYEEVMDLLDRRMFRQRLTQLHLEGDTYEKI